MNVYEQTKLIPYITLTFTTASGTTVVKFDNMEINRDVEIFTQWFPEIFSSSGGIATKLARRQPRRIRFQVKLNSPETICKLNTLVDLTSMAYYLKVCLNKYWDCSKAIKALPAAGIPAGGVVINGLIVAGINTTAINQGTGLLTGGTIVGGITGGDATTRDPGAIGVAVGVPAIGDNLVINGQIVTATAELIATMQTRGVVMMPMCMEAVLRYDQDLMYKGQGRGLGINADTYHVFELLESVTLPIPKSSGIVVVANPDQLQGQGQLPPAGGG